MAEKDTTNSPEKLTLTIDDECIFQTKYESVGDFKNSIHKRVYWKAYDCLIDIIETQTRLLSDNAKTRNYNANNVIAFVGDRGTGKTTCMRNFRRSLRNVKEDSENRKASRVEFYTDNASSSNGTKNTLARRSEKLKSYFELAGVVDPSLFTAHNSLLEIVIAQMFKKFLDKDTENLNLQKKQELAIKFERVYRNIRIIYSNKEYLEKESIDNLEALEMLSNAISFKEDMRDLVENYIEFMRNDQENGSGFLVIAIDDIDVNLLIGERMIEDIRKYLTIPRVIILLAVKIEQLEETIKESYLKDLNYNVIALKTIGEIKRAENPENKSPLKDELNVCNYYEKLNNKAIKYLIKVIPENHRLRVDDFSFENVYIRFYLDEYPELKPNDESLSGTNSEDINAYGRLKVLLHDTIGYNLEKENGDIRIVNDKGKVIAEGNQFCCNMRLFIELIAALLKIKKSKENKIRISVVETVCIDKLIKLLVEVCK